MSKLLVICFLYITTIKYLTAQVVYIPDQYFKNVLIGSSAINTNNDNEIQVSEAMAYNGMISISGNGLVSDLTGIEAFINLGGLNCSSNKISNLDLSNNTKLTNLSCYSNNLTSLNLFKNKSLQYLECYFNQLTSLNIDSNINLIDLYCHYNLLTNLNVNNNPSLQYLHCENNQLNSIDVSHNPLLKNLNISNNQVDSIDISNNTALTYLNCGNNVLSNINLSNNNSLIYLYTYGNLFEIIDVHLNASLTAFDCSNNPQLNFVNIKNGKNIQIANYHFYAINNPNLTCIQVDNLAYCISKWKNIDSTTNFSEDCSLSNMNNINTEIDSYLYPNISSGIFTCYSETSPFEIVIFNSLGDLIYCERVYKFSVINLMNEPQGIYYYQLKNENKILKAGKIYIQ